VAQIARSASARSLSSVPFENAPLPGAVYVMPRSGACTAPRRAAVLDNDRRRRRNRAGVGRPSTGRQPSHVSPRSATFLAEAGRDGQSRSSDSRTAASLLVSTSLTSHQAPSRAFQRTEYRRSRRRPAACSTAQQRRKIELVGPRGGPGTASGGRGSPPPGCRLRVCDDELTVVRVDTGAGRDARRRR
jgi:hypothetical protein